MDRKKFEKSFKDASSKVNENMDKILEDSFAKLPKNVDGTANLVVVMEEFLEISQEISKYLRGKGDKVGITEELADAYLSIKYAQKICGISDKDLNKAINVKLDRQEQRNKDK